MTTEQFYKVIFDNGVPFEEIYNNETELKQALKKFYIDNVEMGNYFNVFVYNEKDEDLSESQFITELIEEIFEEIKEDKNFCFCGKQFKNETEEEEKICGDCK